MGRGDCLLWPATFARSGTKESNRTHPSVPLHACTPLTLAMMGVACEKRAKLTIINETCVRDRFLFGQGTDCATNPPTVTIRGALNKGGSNASRRQSCTLHGGNTVLGVRVILRDWPPQAG